MISSIAILAGGLASRLHPLTKTIPKSLVDVAGKPFIYHQLNALKLQGIKRVILCVGHLGYMIQAEIGNGDNFGLDILYCFDGMNLLGTGGALKQALPLLDDCFFVMYGDSYLPIDFSSVHAAYKKANKKNLMTVLENNDRFDKSNVLFLDGELIEYNKFHPREEMRHIDYGLAIMSKSAFDAHAVGESFDLADIYHQLSIQRDLSAFEVNTRFYEIGSHNGLKETEDYFLYKDSL